jgi:hypothetical protein
MRRLWTVIKKCLDWSCSLFFLVCLAWPLGLILWIIYGKDEVLRLQYESRWQLLLALAWPREVFTWKHLIIVPKDKNIDECLDWCRKNIGSRPLDWDLLPARERQIGVRRADKAVLLKMIWG